ncbi:MAG: hypothetical protein A2542_02515 [Parcubacteria group bacterium RIFOXYD2_FULL_52_8]|nr:MAG: hypothetical protein A2542_02515 [Parcubacteria group bacterium RIFOXYD2_FULL_52_8]
MCFHTKKSRLQAASGFTVIELVVTLAIFVVMTTIVLANYPKFNDKIGLEVLAQNIALSIREAQVYGISVRAENVLQENLAPAYGIHFWGGETNLQDQVQQGKAQYVLFADDNATRNNVFDGQAYGASSCLVEASGLLRQSSAQGECVQVYTITGQSEVGIICAGLLTKNSGISDPVARFQTNLDACKNDPLTAEWVTEADVVFRRPNPEATITVKTNRGRVIGSVSDLEVFVRQKNGGTSDRMVTIWNTGQISVRACDSRAKLPDGTDNPNEGVCAAQ